MTRFAGVLILIVLFACPVAAETANRGKRVYENTCATCHAGGLAGAPKLGDGKAWQKRLDKGMDTLVKHAIDGFQGDAGNMPAKGGNPSLSDAEVEAAVKYMVEKSRQPS